jgi:hypothetical protein
MLCVPTSIPIGVILDENQRIGHFLSPSGVRAASQQPAELTSAFRTDRPALRTIAITQTATAFARADPSAPAKTFVVAFLADAVQTYEMREMRGERRP